MILFIIKHYDFIYNKTKELSDIILSSTYGKDNGIYKGRYFATVGERESSDKLKIWIDNNIDNLDATSYIERIGNENAEGPSLIKMKRLNNKIEILNYEVKLRNGTSGSADVIIPLNESFPYPKLEFHGNLIEYSYNSNGWKELEWPPIGYNRERDGGIDLSDYGVNTTTYNISYLSTKYF